MSDETPKATAKPNNLVAPFGYALQGLAWVWQSQRNIKIHSVIALGVIVAGFILHLAPWEWAVVGMLIGGMLAIECLNTAIEAAVDLVCGNDYHRLAKAAKDVAAGACLLWALTSMALGLLIFWPKALLLLTQ